MTRIPAQELVSVFRSMLGWPYASLGSNGPNGIDCSGASAVMCSPSAAFRS